MLAFWACAGAAVIIASDRERVRRFLTLMLLIAVWFAIQGTFAYAAADRLWYLSIDGTDYGGLGDTVGQGAVIAVAILISGRRFGPLKWGMTTLLGLFFVVLLVAGKRQPLVGLTAVLLVTAVMGFRPAPGGIVFKRFQRVAFGMLLAVGIAGIVASVSGKSFTLARLSRLMDDKVDRSAATRLVVMAQAVQFWAGAPLIGNGVGSFPILEGWGTDESRYPHNIILEVLSDLGLVGLILFGAFLLSALRSVKLQRLRDDPLFRCIFLLAVFDLSAAMVQQDVTEHRLLYAMLGLLALPAMQELRPAGGPLGSSRPGGEEQPQGGAAPDRGRRRTISIR